MLKLREINPLMEQFMAEYATDECTDERRIALESMMSELEMEKESRMDSLEDWRRSVKAEGDFLSAEIERLQARKKSHENLAERIKQFETYLLNGEKLKTPFYTYYYIARKHVVVTDLGALPENLIRRYDPEPKKDEIYKWLNGGEQLDGAYLEAGTPSLAVR